jgi:hypothetical protein
MLESIFGKDTEEVTYDSDFKMFQICGAYYPLTKSTKTFPGLNDLLHEAERHPMSYNRMKKNYETIAINAIRVGLRGWKPTGVVIPHYVFGEPLKGQLRDYDNIVSAGRKIINDALVKSGYLKDDNPHYLKYGTNKIVYVEVPYIKVYLEEEDATTGLDNTSSSDS